MADEVLPAKLIALLEGEAAGHDLVDRAEHELVLGVLWMVVAISNEQK